LKKLKLTPFQSSENFHCFSIFSSFEDFRLAYFINKTFKINLKRKKSDIHENHKNAHFSQYEFLDETNFLTWKLINNKAKASYDDKSLSSSLFQGNYNMDFNVSLFDELKDIDYILSIENIQSENFVSKVLNKLLEIEGLIMAQVSTKILKNKDNLIFS
tara:strand:+ start:1834 stop:2310 length:477 start_codon:yes stop_codon:yes gene_type:complete